MISLHLGGANASFFTQLFSYMFETVELIEPGEEPSDRVFDAMLEPSIDAFEFSVPSQTKTDAFAVWIRYRIKVYDRHGTWEVWERRPQAGRTAPPDDIAPTSSE